jgi:anti-sigma factor RsiW
MLAAYADGELEGGPDQQALKQQVQEWLADHPAVAADLAALRRLRGLCREAAPEEPGEAAWAGVLTNVADHLDHAPAAAPARRRLWRLLVLGGGGLAAAVAAVWVTLALLHPGPAEAPPVADRPAPEAVAAVEPLPVVSEDEVEILSVEAADTGTLVVGVPPVRGPLELVGPHDITLISRQPAPDNMVPDVQMDGRTTPMAWARIGNGRD